MDILFYIFAWFLPGMIGLIMILKCVDEVIDPSFTIIGIVASALFGPALLLVGCFFLSVYLLVECEWETPKWMQAINVLFFGRPK